MKKPTRLLLFGLTVAGLCALGVQTAKADTLSPIASTSTYAEFTGTVSLFDNGYPTSSTNPLVTTDNIFFYVSSGSGLSVQLVCTGTCPSGGDTASLYGPQVFTGPTSAPLVAAGSFTFSNASDVVCEGGACNTTADPSDIFTITIASPDVFSITSASISGSFTLSGTPATTPESSTLLMLASGLLGLGWLGLRRRTVD